MCIEWDTFLLFDEYFSQEKKTMIVRVVLNLTTNILLARKLSIEDIRYLFHNSFILVRFYKHVLSIFQERTHIPTHICINLNLPLRSPIISRNRELASCSRCNFYFATITIRISIWMSGHVTNVECYQAWEESYEYLTSAEYSHDTFVSIA